MNKLSTSKKLVGIRESTRALKNNKVKLAYIARDAKVHIVFPFEESCKNKKIKIVYVDSMLELAKACSVEVPTSVAVILQ